MRIGILRHSKAGYAEQQLVTLAALEGHTVNLVNPLDTILGINDAIDYDVIISRAEVNDFTDPAMDAYLRMLNYYEMKGVPIVNPASSLLLAQDKFRTHLALDQAGILTPSTFLGFGIASIYEIIKQEDNSIEFPVVLKKPYGGRAEGVFVAMDGVDLERKIEEHFDQNEPILVQEYIWLETNDTGKQRHMRTFVCRDPATQCTAFIGGLYFNATDQNGFTNASVGGHPTSLRPYPTDVVVFSKKALDAIGADFAGVDLIRDSEGTLYVLEINISPDGGEAAELTMGTHIWKEVIDLTLPSTRYSNA